MSEQTQKRDRAIYLLRNCCGSGFGIILSTIREEVGVREGVGKGSWVSFWGWVQAGKWVPKIDVQQQHLVRDVVYNAGTSMRHIFMPTRPDMGHTQLNRFVGGVCLTRVSLDPKRVLIKSVLKRPFSFSLGSLFI
ncbi:hypothetical protein CEXT_615441 [Caerostris extrusa]|uniref:Uncharacterized protein n=1 Tax=Caerostris extrusa TaxID=172846 RepID=A0AAV4QJI0_CAEEX|nr:hypothetical protein CEXT_615441 [Caerostris extrusa]